MSTQRLVGLALLVVVSLGIGFGAGSWYYSLYVDSIPEALKATTSLAGTRVVFLWNGFLIGAIVAVWTLVAIFAARFFRPKDEFGRDGSRRRP